MREYPYDGHQAIDVFLGAKNWPPEQKKAACLHLLDDLAQRLRIASETFSELAYDDEVKTMVKKLNCGLEQRCYALNNLIILTKASEQIGFNSKDAMALLDDVDAMWDSLNTTNRLPGFFLEEFITISGLKCNDVSVPLSFMQLPKSQIDTLMDNMVANACEENPFWAVF